VGPHIARMIVGEDQRFFLPLSAMIGALVLSLTSIILSTRRRSLS
jgi:iron complex transport system permease protein